MRCHAFWPPARRGFLVRFVGCCLLHDCLVRFLMRFQMSFAAQFSYEISLWNFLLSAAQFSCKISLWDFVFCSYILIRDFLMRWHAFWALRALCWCHFLKRVLVLPPSFFAHWLWMCSAFFSWFEITSDVKARMLFDRDEMSLWALMLFCCMIVVRGFVWMVK